MFPLAPQDTSAIDRHALNLLFAQTLVMARFYGFFNLSPFFSRSVMPGLVRLGVIAAVSFVATPAVFEAMPADGFSTWLSFVLIVKEMMLGLFMGTLVWIPARGLEIAGVIVDTQRAANQSQPFDPIFAEQTTPTATLLAQVFAGYFFAAGGFLAMLMAIYKSFALWPALSTLPPLSAREARLFIDMAGTLFVAAVVLIAPISGFMLIADIVIAFLARSAQSLNALTLGMPVKSGILIFMMMFYIHYLFPALMQAQALALAAIEKSLGP